MQLGWGQIAKITGRLSSNAPHSDTVVENLHTPAQEQLKCRSAVQYSYMLYLVTPMALLLHILSA